MEHNPLNTAPLSADHAAGPRRPYTAPLITDLSSTEPEGKLPVQSSEVTVFSYMAGPS